MALHGAKPHTPTPLGTNSVMSLRSNNSQISASGWRTFDYSLLRNICASIVDIQVLLKLSIVHLCLCRFVGIVNQSL